MVDAAAEDHGLVPAADDAGHGQQHHAERGDLDAAARAARRRADEHEQRHEDLGEIRHIPQRDAVVARCAGGDRLERRVGDLVEQVHRPQRERIVILHEQDARSAQQEQPAGDPQNQLCVCAQVVCTVVGRKVLPDKKAQSAADDEQ